MDVEAHRVRALLAQKRFVHVSVLPLGQVPDSGFTCLLCGEHIPVGNLFDDPPEGEDWLHARTRAQVEQCIQISASSNWVLCS